VFAIVYVVPKGSKSQEVKIREFLKILLQVKCIRWPVLGPRLTRKLEEPSLTAARFGLSSIFADLLYIRKQFRPSEAWRRTML